MGQHDNRHFTIGPSKYKGVFICPGSNHIAVDCLDKLRLILRNKGDAFLVVVCRLKLGNTSVFFGNKTVKTCYHMYCHSGCVFGHFSCFQQYDYSASTLSAGSENQNLDPFPNSLSNPISPFMAPINCLDRCNPAPKPWYALVLPSFIC